MSGLAGKTILLTRTRESNESDANLVRRFGATPVSFPAIRLTEPSSWEACDAAIIRLRSYDAVVFTSANAVRAFLARIGVVHPDAQQVLAHRRLYAVGRKTAAALSGNGMAVTLALESGTATDLADAIGSVEGQSILFPKSEIARDVLPSILRSRNAMVDEIVVYTTVPPPPGELETVRAGLHGGGIDAVLFFSPSAVRNAVQLLGTAAMRKPVAAVIGPTTAEAAREAGLRADVVAPQPTAEALLDSLADYFQNRQA
ncbi:MAG: hypothetical protein HBSIN02_24620 [Bacteroidia bacterium]|nr:MAG: hypothetical protein HBSIN02_24620 [Bacteroidia bacterium]